ncbi:MAG: GNAT family N-acetyltransferase [Rhodobacteraceae bacterium]|nr:GNAT family N-acetyltransferase [Paracoccaceae bacterium]
MNLVIKRDDQLGPDALKMIDESEVEQAALYRPEHRTAFSPEQLIDGKVRFLVAYIDDQAVGCGGVAPLSGFAELKRIFVTRSARGQGIAGKIFTALEAEAKSLGFNLVRLETGTASPEAIRAYEKSGYDRIGPFGGYVENSSSVFMEKNI